MSYTEPTADAGQPTEGQATGGDTGGGQPYADYLSRVPEEVRGDIEPIFKDWNSSVNKQFENHASFRKQWEPFEQIGLNQYQPDHVQWALNVAQAAQNDPAAMRAWLDETHGPMQAAQPDPAQQPEFSTFDQYGADPRIDQFAKQLEQIQQWQQQQDQRWQDQQHQAQQSQIQAAIDAETAALEKEHAASLPKEMQDNFSGIIEMYGAKYARPGADPAMVVQSAWRDFQAHYSAIQAAALQEKVDQPQTPVTGGGADVTPDQPKTLKEANALALQQWRANQAA